MIKITKKLWLLVLAVLVLLGLSGCETETNQEKVWDGSFGEITIYKDTTGCEYLVYNAYRAGGITARLNPDGTPICWSGV